MALAAPMQFAVEAWDPDYGTGGDADGLDPSTDVVDANLEMPAEAWAPIDPGHGEVSTVYFVDGVRRIDARIWVTDDSRVLPGSCATVAAGSVVCTPGKASIHELAVKRVVLTPPAETATSIETTHGRYEHVTIATGSPEDLYLGIHEEMTRLETQTVPVVDIDDGLVVFDGPLRGRTMDGSVGLIKTQHVQYLEGQPLGTVSELESGQRTPLFTIGSGQFARASWYLRLPGPRTHGWAGILRCEIPARPDLGAQVTIANRVSALLPRYASEPHKEQRAPQNLYPIAGLERALRARLGDQRLLQRALREAAR